MLITGANSYIGESVKSYLLQTPNLYYVDIKDTIGWEPKQSDFVGYDVVFNVAGVAHIRETKQNQHIYYEINRDLIIKIAKTAKKAGVKQFILLSSMSVYGMTVGRITKSMSEAPVDAYGKSKVQADKAIKKLEDKKFGFACLRPPMVYGKGCKGNYQKLRAFALKTFIFPEVHNHRSMIYIGNLCEFVKDCIDKNKTGLFFPQNAEYSNTSEMVKIIAHCNGKTIKTTKIFNWLIKIIPGDTFKKVFGSLIYEKTDLVNKYGLRESIILSEDN